MNTDGGAGKIISGEGLLVYWCGIVRKVKI